MPLRTVLFTLLLSLVFSSVEAAPAARRRSLEDRLAATKAVERVFWSHRIWPRQNPGPKPVFEAVVSRAALQMKVEDSLRLSNAVEQLRNLPIARAQLLAELDRIVAGTEQPALLREILTALGNDRTWSRSASPAPSSPSASRAPPTRRTSASMTPFAASPKTRRPLPALPRT